MSAVVTSDGLETVSVQVQTKCQWSDEVVKDPITGKYKPVGHVCGKPTKIKANGLRYDFCEEHLKMRQKMYKDRSSAWKERAEISRQRKAVYHDSMLAGIEECKQFLSVSPNVTQKNIAGRVGIVYRPSKRSDSFSWHAKQAPTSVAQLNGSKKESANHMLGINAWLPAKGSFVLLLDQSPQFFGDTKDKQFGCAEIMQKHVSDLGIGSI